MILSDFEKEFLIEEYKALKIEIQSHIEQTRKVIYFNIVFSGIIWSFFLTKDLSFNFLIKWTPALIICLSTAYNYSLGKEINRIGDYIRQVENTLVSVPHLGWENHLYSKTHGSKHIFDKIEISFWVVFLLANLFAAIIM